MNQIDLEQIQKEELLDSRYNLDFLEILCRNRMDELGHSGIQKYEDRYKEEYNVIVGAGLENYFLIIWDILNFCKEDGMLTGLSRGSAAGSYIMYLMDIVKINPFDYNLLFSRFLNAGRVASIYLNFHFKNSSIDENYKEISRLEIPKNGDRIAAKYFIGDILNGEEIVSIDVEYKGHISLPDVDMDLEDRDRVKQFIIKKYGEYQFSLLGSYNTFKIKAAIKDISRVVGSNMDYATLNVLASTLFFKEGLDANFEEIFKEAQNNSMLYGFIQDNPKVINQMYWLLDTPKSSSVHPCGTLSIPEDENIYTQFPLIDQEGEVMCQWTGPELDSLGYVKNDLLGLSQLAFFSNILKLIKEHQGKEIDIYHDIPLNDPKVYKPLQKGWNSEVFQFNSYLLINYCKTLKPTCIDDLSAAVAAVRPGPMNNGLHLKYAKRKHGEEKVDYAFGYKEYTKETYGVILFQEEIINVASYLGNLTLVEGDGLRKALGKKHMDEMLAFHDKIKPNAIDKGCSDKEFEEIWASWVEFAKYAFNKSHSVAYAITGYISEYLKVYYPHEFWCAAFQKANDSSDRKERFSQYFEELKACNSPIKVVSPDINTATNKTTFDSDEIYFPLNNIKYLSNDGVELILEDRQKNGEYYSFEEFLDRMGKDKKLDARELKNLVLAGTFDKVENITDPIQRRDLIRQIYKFLRKDYNSEFYDDNFQDNSLWWSLKELDLIGVENINFKKEANKYFENFAFFTTYKKLNVGQKISFGGIISDYVERKTKKRNQYFGIVTILNENIPYTLCIWNEEWELYKEDIIKYKGQIILCECEIIENKSNDTQQFSMLKENPPIFLGSSEETKREKQKPISFKKGDKIKTGEGVIGKVIRNASNYDITILLDNGEENSITKWDIREVINE